MLQQRITIRRPDCALWVRLCCKSRFALMTKNSAGYRRGFRVKMWGPYRLTLNSQATSVTRLRLYESAIASRFVFSREIRSPATFDFCNTITPKADMGRTLSAATIRVCGMARSRALAVLRLMTSFEFRITAEAVKKTAAGDLLFE